MKFTVIDIETNENGNPTDFGLYDGSDYYYFDSLDKFVSYLWNYEIIYAHCGLRFDYVILLKALTAQSDKLDIGFNGSAGIFITASKGLNKITLLDSFKLLPSSLDKLCDSFQSKNRKQKLSVMPWLLSSRARKSYLKDDCLALHEILTTFWMETTAKYGVDYALTLPSLALKIFTKSLDKKILTPTPNLMAYEQSSYFGGVCYLNPDFVGVTTDVKIYDFNSHYPSVMRDYKYPISYFGGFSLKVKPSDVALIQITYKYAGGLPFVYDMHLRKLTYEGTAIVDTDTYYYLQTIGDVKIIKAYIYSETGYLFRDFIDDCYRTRLEHGKNSGRGYCAKILMNSLYGKFAEKETKRIISTKEPDSKKVNDVFIYGLADKELFDYEISKPVFHRFPALSSLTTLRARLRLRQKSDNLTVVYADTDSLHIAHGSMDTGTELGQLSLEYEGSAIYLGKKSYQLDNKTVSKGIPVSESSKLDYSEIVYQSVHVKYTGFTTLLDSIQGESFQLKHHQRLLRKLDQSY